MKTENEIIKETVEFYWADPKRRATAATADLGCWYHHLPPTIKPLLGKCLAGFDHTDCDTIRVRFADGTSVLVNVTGDCCSTSIFYGVTLDPQAIGSPLVGIEEYQDTPDADDAEARIHAYDPGFDIECLSVWDVVFRTESGGELRLHHANSSNGYYDGCTSYSIRND